MTQILIATGITATINKAVTDYIPIGTGAATGVTTENTAQMKWETAGTFSGLWANVSVNTVTATSTVAFRDGAASKNQSLSIGASTTGTFQDATNSDTVAAADLIDLQIATGATGTSMTMNALGMLFAPTTSGNTVNKLSCGAGTSTTALSSLYGPLAGQLPSSTGSTEANAQFKNKTTATLNNLSVSVATNATTASTTVRTRVGGANGNLSVSIGSGTTGQFEDTTNSDSLSSGNLVNYQIVPGSASSLSFNHIAVDYLTTSGNTHYLGGSDNTFTVSANVTTYQTIAPGTQVNATESAVQTLAQAAFTASNLEAHIASNTVTATSTIRFRIGAANGNQVLSIGASTTGYFEDTTNTDSVLAASNIDYQIATGATGTTMGINNIGFLAAYGSSGTSFTIDLFCPLEFLASQNSDPSARQEWIASENRDSIAPLETIGTLKSDIILPDEFLAGQAANPPVRMEWPASQASDSLARMESTGSVSVIVDALPRLEWLAAQNVNALTPLEDTANQAANAMLPVESLAGQARDQTARLEMLAAQVRDALSPQEWVGGVSVTSDAIIRLEWLAARNTDALARLESIGNLSANAIAPVEFIALVRADQMARLESLAGAAADAKATIESLASASSDRPSPLEVIASLLRDATSQLEALAGLRRDVVAPQELLAGQSRDTGARAEFSATQAANPQAQFETLVITSAVVSNSMLPLEILAGQVADQRAAIEQLTGNARNLGLLLEILNAPTPTPPGRIINLQLDGRTINLTSVGRIISVSNQGRIL